MKFIKKIREFMYGRYARPDELYKFLFWVYIFLFIIDLFVDSKVLIVSELFILFITLYRLLSRNIYKRSNENKKFLKIINILLRPFINIKRNIKDKDHIYKKCRKCKTVLKLPVPSERGVKYAKCPGCKRRVRILALKKLKVEIIN